MSADPTGRFTAAPSNTGTEGPVSSSRSISKRAANSLPSFTYAKMSTCQIAAEIGTAHQDLARSVRQLLDNNVRVLKAIGSAVSSEEHRFSAAQHLRPSLGGFAFAECCQRGGLPARRRDMPQGSAGTIGREHDPPVLAPGAAPVVEYGANRDGASARRRHLLQLAVGEKRNPPAIG